MEAAPVSIDSDTQLEVTIPLAAVAESNPVVVTNGDGDTAPAFTYTTTAAATCPGVPTFSPATGFVGTTVTISGTLHDGADRGAFQHLQPRHPDERKRDQATAVVPAGATTGPIHVYTAAGQSTSATNFTVVTAPAPTITSFTPAFGPTGTSVTITGTNFSGTVSGASFTTTGVTFNNVAAHVRRELGDPDHGHRAFDRHHREDQGHDPGWHGDQRDQLHGEQDAFEERDAESEEAPASLRGVVSVGDGFTACAASVPVKIQRRDSW